MAINFRLAKQRGVSLKDQYRIEVRHTMRDQLFEEMSKLKPEDWWSLRQLAERVTRIEYELQELWGFERDCRWHEFWRMPWCSCPILDNKDRRGTGQAVIAESCPIHGGDYK